MDAKRENCFHFRKTFSIKNGYRILSAIKNGYNIYDFTPERELQEFTLDSDKVAAINSFIPTAKVGIGGIKNKAKSAFFGNQPSGIYIAWIKLLYNQGFFNRMNMICIYPFDLLSRNRTVSIVNDEYFSERL
ncbi:MAG: hypothetical protein AVO38_01775 [delta proteobacterium ML8_D]|nr:MAG: hypothetical protein AVO38_01775 [delta proteobacterium ML8_D]